MSSPALYLGFVLFILQLMPSDTDIMQTYKKSITEARQFARKMTIVLLSDREKEEEQAEKDKDNKDDKVGFKMS